MHPSLHAGRTPDKPAVIMAATGEVVTHAELEVRSNQGAHLLRSLGLKRGEVIALMLENVPAFFQFVWAAQRAGLYCTCLSTRLALPEIAFILADSGSRVLIASMPVPPELPTQGLTVFAPGARDFVAERAYFPATPIADEAPGIDMLYSSGTTGRPKGIRPPLPEGGLDQSNVPTHFIRMLKLPEAVRARYDHASLRVVFHAAALCPVEVKRAMMDWWGPILYEYYAGTEANGLTSIGPQDWHDHPGSVGRAIWGRVRICGEDGEELPPREIGTIHFSDGAAFAYHNDPDKTAQCRNRHGWTTIGDVGWMDEQGYLYLTDRLSFMIISGGVNIYPQEVEDALVTHPKVADVAIIGAPDPEMGERVVAVVQPMDWADAGPALAEELSQYLAGRVGRFKQPRQIDFDPELPRHPNGKLLKRIVRARYWP